VHRVKSHSAACAPLAHQGKPIRSTKFQAIRRSVQIAEREVAAAGLGVGIPKELMAEKKELLKRLAVNNSHYTGVNI